jgi:hypothetical protein
MLKCDALILMNPGSEGEADTPDMFEQIYKIFAITANDRTKFYCLWGAKFFLT